jgi:hypothetical protein
VTGASACWNLYCAGPARGTQLKVVLCFFQQVIDPVKTVGRTLEPFVKFGDAAHLL